MICTMESYNCLDKQECQALINFFEDKKSYQVRTDTKHRIDSTLDAAQFQSFEPFRSLINERLRKPLHNYFNDYLLNPEYDLSGYKIQHSGPGEGFVGWHHDKIKGENRRMVWMIYLNTPNGGETEFRNLQNHYSVKAEEGKLFLFPVDFTHMHRSAPNLRSDKYIITGWVHDQD